MRRPEVEAVDVARAIVGLVSLVVDGDLSDAFSTVRFSPSPVFEAMMPLIDEMFLRTSAGDY